CHTQAQHISLILVDRHAGRAHLLSHQLLTAIYVLVLNRSIVVAEVKNNHGTAACWALAAISKYAILPI
ncbi:Os10g0497500, partial [Oryza sativa Japonica Group]